MFVFGTAEDIARSLCESIESRTPGLVSKPIDEMTTEEMKRSLVTLKIAAQEARQVGSSEESLEMLFKWHDDVLRELVAVDEKMQRFVTSAKYRYPRKRSVQNTAYYVELAQEGT